MLRAWNRRVRHEHPPCLPGKRAVNLERILKSLKDEEGFRAFLYDDATGLPIKRGSIVKGNPTIGYGWNVTTSPMSESEASMVLGNRIVLAAKDAASLVPNWVTLNETRQDVLIDMAFNLGRNGLFAFKNMLRAVNEGRYDEAADEMMDSAWFIQVGKRGPLLVDRMRSGSEATT